MAPGSAMLAIRNMSVNLNYLNAGTSIIERRHEILQIYLMLFVQCINTSMNFMIH